MPPTPMSASAEHCVAKSRSLDRVDPVEHRLEGRRAKPLEPRLVHVAREEIAHLLLRRSRRAGSSVGQLFDDGEQVAIDFVGSSMNDPSSAVGRNLGSAPASRR